MKPLVQGKWLFFIVTSICLAVSACYEFMEWWAALLGGEAADAFLGTQGDPWDTQWDMFMAFVGAMSVQLLLARIHDRQLQRLEAGAGEELQVAHPRRTGAGGNRQASKKEQQNLIKSNKYVMR